MLIKTLTDRCFRVRKDILIPERVWVNIGSGTGLLSDGTKLLPEPMLPLSLKMSCGVYTRAISWEI